MENVTLTLNLNELATLIRELSPADVRALSERNPPKPQTWGSAEYIDSKNKKLVNPDYKRCYRELIIVMADVLGMSQLTEPNKLIEEIKILKSNQSKPVPWMPPAAMPVYQNFYELFKQSEAALAVSETERKELAAERDKLNDKLDAMERQRNYTKEGMKNAITSYEVGNTGYELMIKKLKEFLK